MFKKYTQYINLIVVVISYHSIINTLFNNSLPQMDTMVNSISEMDSTVQLSDDQASSQSLESSTAFFTENSTYQVSKGNTPQHIEDFNNKLATLRFTGAEFKEPTRLEDADDDDSQNHVLVLEDGSFMFARYVQYDIRLLSEVQAFHLSVLLGMDNVPAARLLRYNESAPQWVEVAPRLRHSLWSDGSYAVLHQWLHGLDTSLKFPEPLMDKFLHGGIVRMQDLQDLDLTQIVEIRQWSDMIVFDYISCQYDRLLYHLYWADDENNDDYLTMNIRNLELTSNRKMWLYDNERSMFDGYGAAYSSEGEEKLTKFYWWLEKTLRILCVFNRHTYHKLQALASKDSPSQFVLDYARAQDPLLDPLEEKAQYADFCGTLFHKFFQERLEFAISWIESCEKHG